MKVGWKVSFIRDRAYCKYDFSPASRCFPQRRCALPYSALSETKHRYSPSHRLRLCRLEATLPSVTTIWIARGSFLDLRTVPLKDSAMLVACCRSKKFHDTGQSSQTRPSRPSLTRHSKRLELNDWRLRVDCCYCCCFRCQCWSFQLSAFESWCCSKSSSHPSNLPQIYPLLPIAQTCLQDWSYLIWVCLFLRKSCPCRMK